MFGLEIVFNDMRCLSGRLVFLQSLVILSTKDECSMVTKGDEFTIGIHERLSFNKPRLCPVVTTTLEQQQQASLAIGVFYELMATWPTSPHADQPREAARAPWDACCQRLKEEVRLRQFLGEVCLSQPRGGLAILLRLIQLTGERVTFLL